MHYKKKGHIWSPTGEWWWARQYATIPTPVLIGDVIRIYFASLDEERFGRIGYIEVDAADPGHPLYAHPEPVLDLGELGAFDDSGVNASCVIPTSDGYLLYYIGWQRCERVPYMLYSGLAASVDGQHFERVQRVPILDRTDAEPYSRSAPFVLIDGGAWHVWYWSCERWSVDHGVVHYNNVIRHATSTDGIHWSDGEVCIAPAAGEYAVGRPWVVHEGGLWRMWYSARSLPSSYVIGYAESVDGRTWTRCGNDILPRSAAGWDSEMVCYPAVIRHRERQFLFYNGNRHGASGIGYAMIESTA